MVRGISRISYRSVSFSVSGVETAHPAPSLYIYQHLLPINHITKQQVLPGVPSSTKGRRACRKGLAHPPTTLMKKLSDTSLFQEKPSRDCQPRRHNAGRSQETKQQIPARTMRPVPSKLIHWAIRPWCQCLDTLIIRYIPTWAGNPNTATRADQSMWCNGDALTPRRTTEKNHPKRNARHHSSFTFRNFKSGIPYIVRK